MTFPGAITAGYYYNQLAVYREGYLAMVFCDCFTFSYHALNICVLLFTNPKFRNELISLLPAPLFRLVNKKITNNKVSATASTTITTTANNKSNKPTIAIVAINE